MCRLTVVVGHPRLTATRSPEITRSSRPAFTDVSAPDGLRLTFPQPGNGRVTDHSGVEVRLPSGVTGGLWANRRQPPSSGSAVLRDFASQTIELPAGFRGL